jgi:CyaY protein
MTEQEFLRAADATLGAIEAALERVSDQGVADLEIERQDNVLTIVFGDDSRIIVNSHTAAREIWVAARSGGFHYRFADGSWIDGRSGDELFRALSRLVGEQGGAQVSLAPR